MLPFVILGFLIDQPRHGYELKRVLSPALTRDRQLNDGVLYPLLAKLMRDGHVRRTVERQRGRPARHVYAATAAGRRSFRDWLATPVHEEDEVTYDFLLGHPFLAKCMFFAQLAPAARRRKLAAQRAAATAKLAEFAAIRKGMIARGVDPFRIAVLGLGIAQQRAKVRWLVRLARAVDRAPRTRRRNAA
jgi:DNA-binding PadR family transcriptional regulator